MTMMFKIMIFCGNWFWFRLLSIWIFKHMHYLSSLKWPTSLQFITTRSVSLPSLCGTRVARSLGRMPSIQEAKTFKAYFDIILQKQVHLKSIKWHKTDIRCALEANFSKVCHPQRSLCNWQIPNFSIDWLWLWLCCELSKTAACDFSGEGGSRWLGQAWLVHEGLATQEAACCYEVRSQLGSFGAVHILCHQPIWGVFILLQVSIWLTPFHVCTYPHPPTTDVICGHPLPSPLPH